MKKIEFWITYTYYASSYQKILVKGAIRLSEGNRREHIRFDPDKNSIVMIFLGSAQEEPNEENKLVGLLRDESRSGCGAVFHREFFPLEEGESAKIKPGKISPTEAEVSWLKPIDEKLIRVGFEYLE